MGVVMILCPNTAKPISTGLQMDRVAFDSMPVFFSTTFCPVCRTSHEWFAASAWVCDYGPANCDPNCDRCKTARRKGSRGERSHGDEGRIATLRDEAAPHAR
jgi:hypothetical protein